MVRGLPTSATNSPGWRMTFTPARSSRPPRGGRAPSRKPDTSEAKCSAPAPVSSARAASSCSGAPAHDEVRAALAQGGAQLPQAAEQEAPARAGLEAAVQQRLVEDEDGHDAAGGGGRGQRGVVVDAQVARNQTIAVSPFIGDTEARAGRTIPGMPIVRDFLCSRSASWRSRAS